MNSKKWSLFLIIAFGILMTIIGVIVFVVDPYFHFHAPLKNFSYRLNNQEYVNDGISKNFSYDAMITGTSMTSGFKTEEMNSLFGVESVRITFLGEGFKRINDNLQSAIKANPELKLVVRSLDPVWFVTDENWMGYDAYPDYLYDDNPWNDVKYLYNKHVFMKEVIPEIVRTIKKEPADTFDTYGLKDALKETEGGYGGLSGEETVLNKYERPAKEIKEIDPAETEQFFQMLQRNVEQNLISTIKDNPDITFYLFIAPYSICWWDSLNQNGVDVLKRRIDLEKYVLEQVLAYDNVKVFSFFNNFDLISDLNNYTDDIHYIEKVNSNMLNWMKEGQYELTTENYLDYIEEITAFYSSYDYDEIFERKG